MSVSLPSSPQSLGNHTKQWEIDHAGRIDKDVFKPLLAVFFGLTTIVTVSRISLRIRLRNCLFLDDYLVLLGWVSLAAATGIIYHYCDGLYIIEAFNIDPDIGVTTEDLLVTFTNSYVLLSKTFVALLWTAIFAIKLSFLAFFRRLIQQVSKRLDLYYKFVVWTLILSWLLFFLGTYFICYDDHSSNKCDFANSYELNLHLTASITGFDIVSDFMVVSIPLIVLRMASLRRGQVFNVAAFLCLSLGMVIVALIRIIAGIQPSIRAKRDFDTVWMTVWLYIEACVAIWMSSVTAIRGLWGHIRDRRRSGDARGVLGRVRNWLKLSENQGSTTPDVNLPARQAVVTPIPGTDLEPTSVIIGPASSRLDDNYHLYQHTPSSSTHSMKENTIMKETHIMIERAVD